MSHKININGLASKTTVFEGVVRKTDLELTLLQYLQNQKIPIASSCSGEGVCQKCIVNKTLISCQVTLKNFIKSFNDKNILIEVEYL